MRPLTHMREIVAAAKKNMPVRAAVVHPVSAAIMTSLAGALQEGILDPVLVGPERKIRAAAAEAGLDISPYRLVDTPHSHAAAAAAMTLARAGEVDAIMKGALATGELMEAAMSKDAGIRTDRRMSHVFVMEVSRYPKLLLITDAAINVEPDLTQKRDIAQNAIDLGHALGIARPKVAILAAVEHVDQRFRSTVDAAALCKMADRGQISGAVLDGPLAFDNAISREAATAKGIVSPVSGEVDILLAPDIEAGNMIAKQLTYLADAQTAGIVLGGRVPVILTSRSGNAYGRVVSIALASLLIRARGGKVHTA
ncbi:MAG: bifunctional enoyl-CoA hydratase/phosphate acetyltransferase [Gammaproteobacteria bacterium]